MELRREGCARSYLSVRWSTNLMCLVWAAELALVRNFEFEKTQNECINQLRVWRTCVLCVYCCASYVQSMRWRSFLFFFFFCGGWYLRLPAKVTLQSIRSVVRPPQFVNWKWLPPPLQAPPEIADSILLVQQFHICSFASSVWIHFLALSSSVSGAQSTSFCKVPCPVCVCVCARDCKSIFGRPGCACIVARWRICIAGPGAD